MQRAPSGYWLIVICCPCLFWKCPSSPEKLGDCGEHVRHGQILTGQLPPPFPPQDLAKERSRALTPLSATGVAQHCGQTPSQSSCLLLTKLPLELRQQIWQECLGGNTFHLHSWSNNSKERLHFYTALCHSPTPEKCEVDLVKGRHSCKKRCKKEPVGLELPNRKLLSILLASRQIYSEAVDCLYSCNAFNTRDINVVHYIDRFFFQQRLTCIRSFRFKWCHRETPPYPIDQLGPNFVGAAYSQHKHEQWTAVWENLAKMTGLYELYIKLVITEYDIGWLDIKTENALVLLKPILEFKAPSVFELWLPYYCNVDGPAWKALPCQIRKTDDTFEW